MPGEPQAAEFVDTNVLVYALTADPRSAAAERLLAKGCGTSVQALNEFANIARRKLGMSWREVEDAIAAIRVLCRAILPVDIETHADGLIIARRDGLSIYDALMVAAALRGGCNVLWSEDMQNGRVIDGRLRIINPFRAR